MTKQKGPAANAQAGAVSPHKKAIPRGFRWVEHDSGVAILSFDVASRAKAATPGSRKSLEAQALTPTQLKVARLAVRGRSNAEIASQLGIALRTVANHMAAILAKTGAASRFELARKLSV